MARRPTFFVLYIIIPVILLSFLNVLVFTIPSESGEKISYGITVLLALSVFMSTISSMLPQATDSIPAVTLYLFTLLVGSMGSVVVSIATVALHHWKEIEEIKAEEESDQPVQDLNLSSRESLDLQSRKRRSLIIENHVVPTNSASTLTHQMSRDVTSRRPRRKWLTARRCVNKHANKVSLIIFDGLWLIASIIFFAYVLG